MTISELIQASAQQLSKAGLAFGHGTHNAFDEAAWLVLWQLGLPLDTPLEGPDSCAHTAVTPTQKAKVAILLETRISTRKPAAYLTREAWLQGVAFYIDERAIVPRSLIAEVLVEGGLDYWLSEATAMTYPDISVDASDISEDALAVARINVDQHGLQERITLHTADGLSGIQGPYDLILCNPPYVNAQSMAALPPEYQAEPALALSGNAQGGSDGMDFIRQLLKAAPQHMTDKAVLVLEIGNEQAHFEAAFPQLETIWLETSAGEAQVLLLTRPALLAVAE
jgi:ribosomal protein L3 glutamine methyltransferase